jgi:hypothetical protein
MNTSAPVAFQLGRCGIDGRFGDFDSFLQTIIDAGLGAEPVLEALQIVLAVIVVLIEHAILASGLFFRMYFA